MKRSESELRKTVCKRSPYFIDEKCKSDNSVLDKRKPDAEDARKSVLTKRSRYFECIHDNAVSEMMTRKPHNFEDVLKRFKASRSHSSAQFCDTTQKYSSEKSVLHGEGDSLNDDRDCLICLCTIDDSDRAIPNSCNHKCFCFSCLVAWGRVTNKCPLCKETFTEITVTLDPNKKQVFSSATIPSESDDDESHGDANDDLVYLYETTLFRPLYGYDDGDGFVVRDDVVEYESGCENDLLEM